MGVVVGAVVGGLVGYLLSAGNSAAALLIALVGFSVAYIIQQIRRSRAEKLGIVLYDEMHVSIAEKSSLQAFRASVLAICVLIILTVWPTFFNFTIVPPEISEKLYPGLALSLGILGVAYWASYAYYVKSKKVIEG